MFRKLGRRFRNLLTRDFDLEEQLLQASREGGAGFSFPPEAFFDVLEPVTGTLEEAKTAAAGAHWKEAGQALLEHFHERLRPQALLHPTDLERLVSAFRAYPHDCRRWVKTAELAVQHRFSPLGGEEVQFGHSIDWYSDFRGGSWTLGNSEQLKQIWSATPLGLEAQDSLLRSWSFNEHGHLLDLARSYWLTGNESYASEAIVQAVDWAERNPIFMGVNWYNPKVVATRALHWFFTIQHLCVSNLMTGELLTRLLRALLLHSGFLALHLRENEKGGTRLVCAAALVLLSGHLPEFTLCKKWNAFARQHLHMALQEDFLQDGFHRSGNLSLHREALDWLLLTQLFDLINSRNPDGLGVTEAGLEALLYSKPPAGQPGEAGAPLTQGLLGRYGGPAEHIHCLLMLGALLLQREDLNPGGEACAELLWWVGPETPQRLAQLGRHEPRGVRRLLPTAQVAVVRDNWGTRANWCELRGTRGRWERDAEGRYCPPDPIALPQHDDALSLCLSAEGEPVFIDPGAPIGGGQLAQAFGRLSSHTAVRIGRELEPLQVAPEPPEAPDRLQLEACRDGHYLCAQRPVWFDPDQPFWLTREVLFLPKKQRVVIRDTLDGAEGEVHFENNLLLAPHLDILMRGDMGSLLRGRKLQARILPLFPTRFRYEVVKGKTHELQGFYWSEAGKVMPTSLLRYYARVPLPCTVSLWVAWNPEDTLSPRPQDVEKLFKNR